MVERHCGGLFISATYDRHVDIQYFPLVCPAASHPACNTLKRVSIILSLAFCFSLPQGNKHRQISDRLRDFQNKKKLQKTELDLTNQRIETRQQDINNLQKQLEVCVFLT